MWEAFKDKQFFLREETWLFILSITSFLDIVSLFVYKKQFIHSIQTFLSNDISNYKVIFLSVLTYIIGAIWVPYIISIIAIFFGKSKSFGQYKLTDYKSYALKHQNNILYDMIIKAEAEHTHDVFIAQLYVWNTILYFVLLYLTFTSSLGYNEIPFYLEAINTSNIHLLIIFFISSAFFLRTGFKIQFYLNSDNYNIFKLEDSIMIENTYPDIFPKKNSNTNDDE